ncbi:unnamed protein product [Caenorhabditis angaria]|uniref:Peptidase M13 C-terminal domain-containing protein n=1 Tax=Caenorhabditis angaria TaxID=860376 RepID=A0A9P1MXS4_9PELO|nr:unnamed protein product [Caenorhabditis angaria]
MIFIKNFVRKNDISRVKLLFEELKYIFNEMIDENEWMDENSKRWLKEELKTLKAFIGEPEEYRNIEKMYERVEKSKPAEQQGYLELVRNLLKMNSEETFLRVARREVMTYQVDSSVMYGSHRISIPSILFSYPFLDENLPYWNTIATLGYFIGHEIGHAFDAQRFLQSEDKQEFEKRVKCITDGSFMSWSIFGVKVNPFFESDGVKTRIADKLGFDLAYRLFKKIRKPQKLPAFEEETIDQQFFQRIASALCAKKLSQKDKHSFRVNGMMSNSMEFAKSFNCDKNTPMNPDKKCPLL